MMKHKKDTPPLPKKIPTPVLDYYSLGPWEKTWLVIKAIAKIIYQKIRHPVQTYRLKKAEIAKHKDEPSPKSKLATLLFCIFCGFLGGHRLYVRRYFSAFLYFATIGFFFLGVFFDLFQIYKNRFRDKNGRVLTHWRVKGDVLALFIALISLFVMTLMLPRALATMTFYSCKAGEYLSILDNGTCNERMIFDTFTSRSSGSLTNEIAPIVKSEKNSGMSDKSL